MLSRLAPLGVLLVSLATAGCGDDTFHVERAAGFPRGGGASVSVFGLYRDGRLAPEAWDTVRPHLAPLFGTAGCDPGYPDMLTSSGTPALQAVDDFTRANGVTDELLDRLSTMAKGDLVLLVTMTGRPHATTDKDTSSPGVPTPTFRGGGRRGGGQAAAGPRKGATAETPTFEAVGLVFSVKAHQSVGVVRMSYAGTSLDEALERFMTRIGTELPAAQCAGWRSDGRIEAADIRRLETETQ